MTDLLISEVYASGGNGGAVLNQDFIEIRNNSLQLIKLDGRSLQYISSTGTAWQIIPLSGAILAGNAIVVGLYRNPSGFSQDLPWVDIQGGSLNLSQTAGTVALVDDSVALSTSDPFAAGKTIDLVGYGAGAQFFEGAPTASPSSTNFSVQRLQTINDTDNNLADFTIARNADPDFVRGGYLPFYGETIIGTARNDRISPTKTVAGQPLATAQDDIIFGGDGNDVLDGGAGADSYDGGTGNDQFVVAEIGDTVTEAVDGGTDLVLSILSFTLGDNVENLTLTGTAALTGTGNALDNRIIGNDGGDTLVGGAGDDVLKGGAAGDRLDGGDDNDALSGGAGSDLLSGGAGKDRLFGGGGADRLVGGPGADVLAGGEDADTFVFDNREFSNRIDVIRDFTSGQDHIEIAAAAFTGLADYGPGALGPGELGFGSRASLSGEHLFYNAATGGLHYDADGAGGLSAVMIARLVGAPTLQPGDIVII